jgi:hypothetical protein
VAQLLDQWLAVTTRTHDLDEILQSGSISYSCRDLGAVDIGSNRCQQAVLHRLLDIIDVAADANAACDSLSSIRGVCGSYLSLIVAANACPSVGTFLASYFYQLATR